jgi:hypothetical protein
LGKEADTSGEEIVVKNVTVKVGDIEYVMDDAAVGAMQAVDMMIETLIQFRLDIIGVKPEEVLEGKTGAELLDGKQ